MNKNITFFFIKKWEAFFWVAALILLYFMNPGATGSSLCVFKWMGFAGCPGCGIGHALHEAMHFNFAASFQVHPLGIFALLIIILRIYKLLFSKNLKINYHES